MNKRPVIEELLKIKDDKSDLVNYEGTVYDLHDLREPDPKWLQAHKGVAGYDSAHMENQIMYRMHSGWSGNFFAFSGSDKRITVPEFTDARVVCVDFPGAAVQTVSNIPFSKSNVVTMRNASGKVWRRKNTSFAHAKRFYNDEHIYLIDANDDRHILGIDISSGILEKKVAVGGFPLNPENALILNDDSEGGSYIYIDDGYIRKIVGGKQEKKIPTKLTTINPLGDGLFYLGTHNGERNYEKSVFDQDLNCLIEAQELREYTWAHERLLAQNYQDGIRRQQLFYSGNLNLPKALQKEHLIADFSLGLEVIHTAPLVLMDKDRELFLFDSIGAKSIGRLGEGSINMAKGQRKHPATYFSSFYNIHGQKRTAYYKVEDLKRP